jgi:hypothetical protein
MEGYRIIEEPIQDGGGAAAAAVCARATETVNDFY